MPCAAPRYMTGVTTSTMSKTIDIFFRGDIAPGHALVEVQEQLKKLFRADDEQIQRLFSGRPVAIRRGLSQEEAERYRDAILEAGALVELRAAKSDSEQTTEPAQSGCQATPTAHGAEEEMPAGNAANTDNSTAGQSTPEDDDGLSLAPLGADVLNADERTRVEGVDVDISALDVEPMEGHLLKDSEKRHVAPVEIDTSHLVVNPPAE